MKIVALPGRNSQTESWLRALLAAISLPSEGFVRYRHWSSDAEASVEFEASLLAGLSPDLVIAKSFGTAVAATAFRSREFRPRTAIFIGTPYADFDTDGVSNLRGFARAVETLFIQQVSDPGGPAAELASALNLTRGDVAEVPGSDHLYQDIDLLVTRVRAWKHTPGGQGGAAA